MPELLSDWTVTDRARGVRVTRAVRGKKGGLIVLGFSARDRDDAQTIIRGLRGTLGAL
jgi:hypothetical protein